MSTKKDPRFNNFRRDSIAVAETRLQSIINEHLEKLRTIWDDVGLDEDQRSDRIDTVINHVDSLFCEMTAEEEQMKFTLKETVKKYKEELLLLSKELHCAPFNVKNEKSLIELESELKLELDTLHNEKHRRLKQYKQLFGEDLSVCNKMGIAAYSISPNVVPTKQQLIELERHLDQNRKDMEYRTRRVGELRTKIVRYMKRLGLAPKNDLEIQITGEQPLDKLPLSLDFIHNLETLETGLQRQYDLYLETIRERIGEVKEELMMWWDRCHVDDGHRNNFNHVDEEDFDEEALDRYTNEIARWKVYYEERQEVLDKIECWKNLWSEKLQYEEKDKDMNRYLNRGGNLLQEEKERKKLEKRLPAVRDEIKVLVQQWNVVHQHDPILLEGMPVLQRLDKIETDYHEKKEKEKRDKQMAKKQQLEAERLYGASPVTPNKKRIGLPIRRGNSPSSHPKDLAGNSRMYVHSSIAMTRSPSQFPAPAAPGAKNVLKIPPGLPRPTTKNSLKRKANEAASKPLMQMNNQRVDDSLAGTTSSGSYGEFVQEIKEKGLQGQSSFIVIPTPTPTKMFKN